MNICERNLENESRVEYQLFVVILICKYGEVRRTIRRFSEGVLSLVCKLFMTWLNLFRHHKKVQLSS